MQSARKSTKWLIQSLKESLSLKLRGDTYMVFRSPISSFTLFSLFMRFLTRVRLCCESLRALLAFLSTASANV